MRRVRAVAIAVTLVVGASGASFRIWNEARPVLPIEFAPAVVFAPIQLEGAHVLGAASDWAIDRNAPARLNEPVPVSITAYCLKGRTRRDNFVREGIVASDPRIFPLARYIEIYVGRKYYGRFLVDDTGGVIKGNKLDIWTPTCREARIFGRQKGTAVLVPRPRGAGNDTLMTGRLRMRG